MYGSGGTLLLVSRSKGTDPNLSQAIFHRKRISSSSGYGRMGIPTNPCLLSVNTPGIVRFVPTFEAMSLPRGSFDTLLPTLAGGGPANTLKPLEQKEWSKG
jgi:hypothetical protein